MADTQLRQLDPNPHHPRSNLLASLSPLSPPLFILKALPHPTQTQNSTQCLYSPLFRPRDFTYQALPQTRPRRHIHFGSEPELLYNPALASIHNSTLLGARTPSFMVVPSSLRWASSRHVRRFCPSGERLLRSRCGRLFVGICSVVQVRHGAPSASEES